jgi:hypothetical protein
VKEKLEKVKTHLKENKKVYIGVTAGIAVGAGTATFVLNRDVVQSSKVIQGVAYKSPVTQNVIQQAIPRAGHAGKVFVDRNDSSKIYMSVRLLADAIGVTRRDVQRYLTGELSDLAGHQFDLFMDGAPPLTAQLTVKG